jgi:hypothetical protein
MASRNDYEATGADDDERVVVTAIDAVVLE